MRVQAVLVPVVGFLIAAGATGAGKATEDKEKKENIAGTWTVVTVERNGEKQPEDRVKMMKLTITKDKMTIKTAERTFEMTYKLDTTKQPATIDMTYLEGPQKDKVSQGIFSLDGDNLKICFGIPDKDRPKEFSTKADSGHVLIVLKREKS